MIKDIFPANTMHALTAMANSIQEICGFVLGYGQIVVIPNYAVRPHKEFEMDLIGQEDFVKTNHEKIIAVFHTHPQGICWPSEKDVENWPRVCSETNLPYLVVTTREVCEFRLDENGIPKPVG